MPQFSRSELESFYRLNIEQDLTELAAGLRRVRIRTALLLATLFTGCFIWYGYARENVGGITAEVLDVMLPVVGLIVTWLLHRFGYAKLNSTFKRTIVPKVLAFLAPEMKYSPKGSISPTAFEASKLYTGFDRSSGADLFSGKYGGVTVDFSEFKAQAQRHSSKGGTYWVTVFNGIFFIGDFQKNFKTSTYVLPDVAERLLGRTLAGFFQKFNNMGWGRGDMARMEDPEFEKRFVVFSKDQIEARYILSPGLMRGMCAMHEKYGGRIGFAFINSSVYIAIPSTVDRFELHGGENFQEVERLAEEIGIFLEIVDLLKLNVRIWTKE